MSEKSNNRNNDSELKDEDLQLRAEKKEPSIEIGKIGKPVIIRAEAYKTIILYASRYANRSLPPEEWKEIYGILIGYSDDEFVYIEEAEALTFGHATDVQLDERHYGFIEEIQEKLDKEKKGNYMIGWFHSHPGLGLFFSYIDLINQLGFQAKNDDFCGLVFDHTLLGKKKKEKVEGTEHSITKYDTGFEIYRITDVNMDINDPEYDNNYHKVDYIIDGLNKYFFANVLSELSALVSEGKPLQSAYREESLPKTSDFGSIEVKSQINNVIVNKKDFLSEIPMEKDITFNVDDFFYGEVDVGKKKSELRLKEEAEQLIYEGNQAFENQDSFIGIEKYRQGIEKYKKFKDYDKVMDLLRVISQKCITNKHFILADEFSEDLYKFAKKQKNLFYLGISNYTKGYLLLKKGESENLEDALHKIQDAAVDFEKEEDYAGAGMCFNKIGTIYQSRLNKIDNASLFYRAAIENFNKAIVKSHPLRTSFWNKPELLMQKIIELRDLVEDLIPKLVNNELKKKIKDDLKKIKYNF